MMCVEYVECNSMERVLHANTPEMNVLCVCLAGTLLPVVTMDAEHAS